MEKASTPRNRLTRSSAKQVNTPKNVDKEESVERSPGEEVKQNVRKTRRRYDSKTKTNGDTTNIENRMNIEDKSEEGASDKYENEDCNDNSKSQDSQKNTLQKNPSPVISRRSLRARRSLTPGPEMELSASKKMKRSSSFGKLDSVSTPTNRRGRRANSESKDFVFTPSKDNQRDSHDLNCKYIPNTTSRIIGKIDEVNEGEKSSEDEREALHREPKDLNKKGFKEEDKIIEPLNIGESFEKESIVKQSNVTENKTYVGETEDPNNINKELYDHVAPNDPCLPNDCDRVEVLDMSENISVLSDKNMVKEYTREEIKTTKDENSESKLELRKSTSFSEENEIEEINTSTKIKYNESNQGPCILPNEDGTDETNTNNEPEPEEIKTDTTIGNDELSLKPLVLDEDNDIEETDTSKNVENNESSDKPCLLAVENKMEPPMVSIFAECIKIPESCSLAKERVQPSELQNCELSLSKSLCNSEDKLSNASDEISQNKDCEISKSEGVYENVGIHEKPVMSSNEINIENCETESDSDNNKTEIVLDNGMEVFDCESAADSKSSSLRNPKIKVGNESPEISKIEVIDSSDSEAEEEQCKVSIVMESKNNEFISENEKLPESATEKNILLNQSLQKQIEERTDEFTTLATGESSKVDPEIRSDHGNLESVKVEENNVNYDSLENTIYNKNETASSNDEARIDRIEDGSNGKTKDVSGLFFVDTEPIEPFNVDIRNQHNNFNDNPVLETHASDVQDEFVRDSLLHDSCPVSDEEQKQNEFEEKETNNGSSLRPNDHEANQFNVSPNKDFHSEFAENFDEARDDDEEDIMENYENEELNKSEEDSCDIYKGLSDSGSYVDEKAEGSQFGESLTSELHSGSVDSEEEYVTSVEDEEEKTGLLHELSGSADQKLRILSKDADEAKNKNPDSPMTYDKALAIINKNRVNKIDDEEFFDMFTQELNRVSEQSGSDSDIAIVDEYIMEPEEPAKKNLPKSGNSQNPKQPPRPTGPALANQPIPHENYPGDFNQSIHGQLGTTINQHGHPIPTQPCHQVMQRVNFSQGPVYQPVDQNMHLRGQLMYHQYAHSSSSLQDPHMYNSSHGIAHPDVNFSGGVLSHPHSICPVSESPFPPNNSPIKIRSLSEMNSAQTHARKNYSNPDQFPLDERHFEHQEGKDNFFGMNSTSVAEAHNLDTSSTRPNISDNNIHHEYSEKKVDKSKTPILDLLGLDSKSLKLLKKVLGLNSIKRELMKRDLEWQKRCLEKSILKSELRQQGRKKETRFRNIKRLRESDSSSIKSSSEESSEEWSATNSDDNREVNIEGGSVFVTLKSKKNPRHLIGKEFVNFKKTCYPGQDSIETGKPIPRNVFSKYVTKNMLIKNKKQFSKEPRSSGAKELDSKKMTKKQSTVVKSQCGAFTVDPLTASSQSSDSEFQSLDSEYHAKELKRKVKRDLASGKNKLSNMFAQNSVRKSNKSKVSKSSQENKGSLKKGKSMEKLTSEILETLAKEDKKKKRQRTEESGSDDTVERPKKIRKRSQKLKVKSKATDQNYIPFVTGGATEFGLSRLDKDGTLTLAEKAAKFRTDQLYGAPVKRITILDFKHQWC